DLDFRTGKIHRQPDPPDAGTEQLGAELARDRDAVVCFESTGGQERQLWEKLEAEGVVARQVPPGQVKAFAQSRAAPTYRWCFGMPPTA
ncbi:hypothetical protein, partial [Puniceibacterium confluentis]|uniref:hypothetical protein n=1 Tax=Puniceibacterium confluentis TaxID=1958944 RepID=UPI001C9519E5